jgi:hypothetical protein
VRDRNAARFIDRATAAQCRALAVLRGVQDPARQPAEGGTGQDRLERARSSLLAARVDLLHVQATSPRSVLVDALGLHLARLDVMIGLLERLAGNAADGQASTGAIPHTPRRAPG